MNTFTYPNGKAIQITEETRRVNNHTWENYQSRVYESDSIQYVFDRLQSISEVQGRANLVDVGAQSGLFALYAKYYDKVHVDAFEPFPKSFKCLQDNINLNGIEGRVKAHQIALSDQAGSTVLRCPRRHTGLNTLGGTPLRFDCWIEVPVQTETIDKLFESSRVDFIKCDTEGWEYFVLKGGKEVLRRDRPELMLEVNPINMDQCQVTRYKLDELLSELGYNQQRVIDGENYVFTYL
jgi:FkbM family methyltransferase